MESKTWEQWLIEGDKLKAVALYRRQNSCSLREALDKINEHIRATEAQHLKDKVK